MLYNAPSIKVFALHLRKCNLFCGGSMPSADEEPCQGRKDFMKEYWVSSHKNAFILQFLNSRNNTTKAGRIHKKLGALKHLEGLHILNDHNELY
jgi:hypothetical protein